MRYLRCSKYRSWMSFALSHLLWVVYLSYSSSGKTVAIAGGTNISRAGGGVALLSGELTSCRDPSLSRRRHRQAGDGIAATTHAMPAARVALAGRNAHRTAAAAAATCMALRQHCGAGVNIGAYGVGRTLVGFFSNA